MTPHEYGKMYKTAAAAMADVGMTLTRKHNAGLRECWMATDGARGTYSAINISKSEGCTMAEGASMAVMKADGELRQVVASVALVQAGLVAFCAVDFFPDIRGQWHGGGCHDQVCLFHGRWEDTAGLNHHMRQGPFQQRHRLAPELQRWEAGQLARAA